MKNKKIVFFLAVGLPATLLLGSCSSEEATKAVVAKVNGAPIYATDLNLGVTRYQQSLAAGGREPNLEEEAEHRAAALETLIENELLFQEAERRGFAAEQQAVDEELATIAGQFPSARMFEEALAQMGISREDLHKDLERAQCVRKMIASSIEPEVVVSAEEVRAYYDGNPRLFLEPERIRARHILLKITEDATEAKRAEARRTLEDLRRRALQGESFAELARKYSQDPAADDGGDLGYFSRGQMVSSFEEAAFALPIGGISGVVSTPFGYHLIQLVDRRPPTPLAFERIQASLTQFLQQRRVDEEVKALTRKLREKAKIKVYKKQG